MSQRFYIPFTQLFTNLGAIAPGWKVKTYLTGTDTPKATYSDTTLSTPNANPATGATTGNQVADANGRLGDMFVASASQYKIVLTDQNNVEIQTTDPVDPFTITVADLSPRPVYFAGTTSGTSTTYVLAASPIFTAYTSTDTFELTFHTACGNSPTLQYVAGGSQLNLKQYTDSGTKTSILAGQLQNQTYLVRNDGVDVVVLNPSRIFIKKVAQQVYTSSTTYTPADGISYFIVEVIGGGGSGGDGGGGSAGYSRSILTAAQVGASQVLTVGAGGAGTTGGDGNAGGDSSFGAIVVSHGGGGGKAGTVSNPACSLGLGGSGGAVGTGQITYAGGDGAPAMNLAIAASSCNASGSGAASYYGGGGGGVVNGGGDSAGKPGLAAGSGGSGRIGGGTSGGGANGVISVTELYVI